MTHATVVAGTNLEEMLEEHGIDAAGGTLIPLVVPINSLSDLPEALKNLGINAESVSGQKKGLTSMSSIA